MKKNKLNLKKITLATLNSSESNLIKGGFATPKTLKCVTYYDITCPGYTIIISG